MRPDSPSALRERCPNCGEAPGPAYCGHCGQEVRPRHGPLLPLLREMVGDWFSLDGRLVRTATALLQPGRLTRRYREGYRAPYLRPMRLYLVASLLLFSSVLTLQAPKAENVDIYIAGEWINESEVKPPPEEGPVQVSRPRFSLLEPDSFLGRYILSQPDNPLERVKQRPSQEILDIVFGGLRRLLPMTLVLFLPFLALALKILYWRTGCYYVDHLIFAAHFQSALFLALALTWLITRIFGTPLVINFLAYALVFVLTQLIYLPMALRWVYQQPRWLTGLKTLVLVFSYFQLLKLVFGFTVLWVIWQL